MIFLILFLIFLCLVIIPILFYYRKISKDNFLNNEPKSLKEVIGIKQRSGLLGIIIILVLFFLFAIFTNN